MSGRSPPLYCTLILITMHSHQSYPNITTVVILRRSRYIQIFLYIHSYEYSTTVDNSTIETYRNGAGVNSKMYTNTDPYSAICDDHTYILHTYILYNIINCHARVF